MTVRPYCIFERGRSPVVAAAIHHGHDTRQNVEHCLALDDQQRLHEEDPITGEWSQVAMTQIIGLRSRFEVDLNRSREHAVYRSPEDAWGLRIWNCGPDALTIEESLEEYDSFYRTVHDLLQRMVHTFGHVVVYDLHSYNYRRQGQAAPPADSASNPEVNVGTGSMDREHWQSVVDTFIHTLRSTNFRGRRLDVRENVKFQGGHFPQWIHQTFPHQVCAIAIEFKKFFMDEWTGERYPEDIEAVFQVLNATIPPVEAELRQL